MNHEIAHYDFNCEVIETGAEAQLGPKFPHRVEGHSISRMSIERIKMLLFLPARIRVVDGSEVLE